MPTWALVSAHARNLACRPHTLVGLATQHVIVGPPARPAAADGEEYVTESFQLESGLVLRNVKVVYKTWGELNAAADNVIFVAHALTGNADAQGWWGGVIGPGLALDTDRFFVVCANILGSCYGTTGPLEPLPAGGVPWASSARSPTRTDKQPRYAADFPYVTVRDTVALHREMLDSLGVRAVHAVVGGSLGGMQALEWLVMYPELVKRGVLIACSAFQSAWQIGISETQRQAIYRDPKWRNGFYALDAPPADGLAIARQGAMIWCVCRLRPPPPLLPLLLATALATPPPPPPLLPPPPPHSLAPSPSCRYRSHPAYMAKFGRQLQTPEAGDAADNARSAAGEGAAPNYSGEGYLEAQGRKVLARFDANSYVSLTRTLDSHHVGRGRGEGGADAPVEQVLAAVQQPVLVVGLDSDVLYPLDEQRFMAGAMPHATLKVVRTMQGHDGFLLEHEQIGALVSAGVRAELHGPKTLSFPREAFTKPSQATPPATPKCGGWAFAI